MDAYLTKPIDPTKLIEAIQSLLNCDLDAAPAPIQQVIAHVEEIIANRADPQVAHETTSQATPPIEIASLLDRCMNDAIFCGEVLAKFTQRAPKQLATLEQALAAGNSTELAEMAHTIKGSAANLSAEAVRAQAAALETYSRQGDLVQAAQTVDALRRELHECLSYIPSAIEQLSSAQSLA
jgi:HPt (histidine-containing phosphotransfer) domain-containing protein